LRSFHDQLEMVDQRFDFRIHQVFLWKHAAPVVDIYRAIGQPFHDLPDHVDGFVHLPHANVIAVVVVPVDSDGHFEIELAVRKIGRVLPQVARHAGRAQYRACEAPVDGVGRGNHADVTRAVDEDAVAIHETVDAADE